MMMPLAPFFMKEWALDAQAFGALVSSYTWAAGIAGFGSIFFLDRVEKRSCLLACLLGFSAGTIVCGLSDSYWSFLVGRLIAGLFAGVMAATILAIVADVVAEENRGKAYGAVMAAFPVAATLGVPLCLYLATRFSWHQAFLFVAALGIAFFFLCLLVIPRVRKLPIKKNIWIEVKGVLLSKRYFASFSTNAFLRFSGFLIIPYLSAFLVSNVGIQETELAYVYLVGGGFTFFTTLFIGSLADRFGGFRVFLCLVILSFIPMLALTHMGQSSLGPTLAITTLFMVFLSGRWTPAMAMMSLIVEPERRGSFMSVLTGIQHISVGFGSYVGGLIIFVDPQTELLWHYPSTAYLAIFVSLLGVASAYKLNTQVLEAQKTASKAA